MRQYGEVKIPVPLSLPGQMGTSATPSMMVSLPEQLPVELSRMSVYLSLCAADRSPVPEWRSFRFNALPGSGRYFTRPLIALFRRRYQ